LILVAGCSPAGEDRAAPSSGPGSGAPIPTERVASGSEPAAFEPDPAAGPASAPARDPAAGTARIVSLSPVATRFLVELGVGALIVAVDADSRRLPGFERHPIAAPADADRFAPDYLLLPDRPDADALRAAAGRSGAEVVEFAPHDLEDVAALCRRLGVPLVGEDDAMALERRITRPLALVAGQSPNAGRPRVLAIVNLDPLEIAGGHSFETDLIEIAGGDSLTHGSDDTRRRIEREDLARFAPDLVLVMTAAELGSADQDRAVLQLSDTAPVAFFPFAAAEFWLGEPARDAERLRAVIGGFRPDGGAAGPGSAPRRANDW